MRSMMMLVLIALGASSVYSQTTFAEQQAREMRDKLSLTDQQFEQVRTALDKYANSLKGIDYTTAAWEDSRKAVDSLERTRNDALRTILKHEQFVNWMEQQNSVTNDEVDRAEARKHVEEVKRTLKLSDEQAQKLEDLTFDHIQYVKKMKAVQRDSGQLQPIVFTHAKSEYLDGVREILSKAQYDEWQRLEHDEVGG